MKDFEDGVNDNLNVGWWALKIGLGVGPIVAGIDKYFNKLADWGMYLSPAATKVLPVSGATFMHVVGVVEIVAGLIVLSRWTRAWKLHRDGVAVGNCVESGHDRNVLRPGDARCRDCDRRVRAGATDCGARAAGGNEGVGG